MYIHIDKLFKRDKSSIYIPTKVHDVNYNDHLAC